MARGFVRVMPGGGPARSKLTKQKVADFGGCGTWSRTGPLYEINATERFGDCGWVELNKRKGDVPCWIATATAKLKGQGLCLSASCGWALRGWDTKTNAAFGFHLMSWPGRKRLDVKSGTMVGEPRTVSTKYKCLAMYF